MHRNSATEEGFTLLIPVMYAIFTVHSLLAKRKDITRIKIRGGGGGGHTLRKERIRGNKYRLYIKFNCYHQNVDSKLDVKLFKILTPKWEYDTQKQFIQ